MTDASNLSFKELKQRYRSQHDKQRNFDWIERNIYSSVAMPFLKAFLRTNLTANHITVLSFIIGLLACVFLALPGFTFALIAAILLQLAYILDYVDGAYARAKNQSSNMGVYLEKLFSLILGSAILFCAGLGSFTSGKGIAYLFLGISSAAGFSVIRIVYDRKILSRDFKKTDTGALPKAETVSSGSKSAVSPIKSFIKNISLKVEFIWVPIYFIDFIAVAALLNKLYIAALFYGVTFPLLAAYVYSSRMRGRV